MACGEGGNQVCAADELRGSGGGGGSAEMGRAQALVSVAQECRAETPLANGHGTVVMDDVLRKGERVSGKRVWN